MLRYLLILLVLMTVSFTVNAEKFAASYFFLMPNFFSSSSVPDSTIQSTSSYGHSAYLSYYLDFEKYGFLGLVSYELRMNDIERSSKYIADFKYSSIGIGVWRKINDKSLIELKFLVGTGNVEFKKVTSSNVVNLNTKKSEINFGFKRESEFFGEVFSFDGNIGYTTHYTNNFSYENRTFNRNAFKSDINILVGFSWWF